MKLTQTAPKFSGSVCRSPFFLVPLCQFARERECRRTLRHGDAPTPALHGEDAVA